MKKNQKKDIELCLILISQSFILLIATVLPANFLLTPTKETAMYLGKKQSPEHWDELPFMGVPLADLVLLKFQETEQFQLAKTIAATNDIPMEAKDSPPDARTSKHTLLILTTHKHLFSDLSFTEQNIKSAVALKTNLPLAND